MNSNSKSDCYEIPLVVLLEIANDISQRAVRAGFSSEYLSCCTVTLPKDFDFENLSYGLEFPSMAF
jgi:hypothetical protein